MITKVTKENSKLYRELFDKAEIYLNGQDAFDEYQLNPDDLNAYVAIHSLDEYFAVLEELTTGQNFDGTISADEYHVFKILPLDEPTFDINTDSRDITVPEVFRKNGVGVQGDQLAETLFFTIDRYFETIDLFRDDIQGIVQWESAVKGKQFETGYSPIAFKDVTIVKNKMVFGWFLNNIITSNPGTVKFSVRFFSTIEDTDSNNKEILKLNFSLSTKTQTITINPAIAFDINDESGLPEVNAYNDLKLVTGRFKDSVYVGEADSAEDPVFTVPEGIVYDGQLIETIQVSEESGKAYTLHVVDLKADDSTLILTSEATSTDAGKISYFWWGKELEKEGEPTPNEEKIASAPIYIQTKDIEPKAGKKYYTLTENVGAYVEVEFLEGETFTPGIAYFETYNGITVDSTGEYWVVAKNRHGVASAEVKSDVIKVPGPEALTVEAPEATGNFLNEEGSIELNIIGTTEQINDKIHYKWTFDGELLQDEEIKSNQGFDNEGVTKNVGSKFISENVNSIDLPYYDKTVKAVVWAERNGDKTENQEFDIRVTAVPQPLTVGITNQLILTNQTDDAPISVIVSKKIGDDERDIVSDNIKYQWYKFTSDETDGDLIIEGATEAEYIVAGGEAGPFYCKVTNEVNGGATSVDSDTITVVRS